MASTITSDLDDSIDTSVFEQSSPESLRPRALSPPAHDHSSSTSNRPILDDDFDEDYFGPRANKICSSSRSSISSFPSSVIHTISFTDNEEGNLRTPSLSRRPEHGRNSPSYKTSSNNYLSAFRHPNSVRALQLDSDWTDSDNHSAARSSRVGRSPKLSYLGSRSPGSTQSSPTKRSSRSGTPQHQRSSSKLKKEFPLVLLHCTLLPPSATTSASSVSEEILEAVLPEEYRKRWRTVQDKVVKNIEVKQRGILIAHPRDDYDLLEERILEALELKRPRIRKGHYIAPSKSDSDSGFESSSQTGTDDGSETAEKQTDSKDQCQECGTAVSCQIEQDRKWEVKVFAANGLMRSGAWSAAWEQMEKVDVEVAVWMPEHVRFEVEEKLKVLQAMEEAERPVEEPSEVPATRPKKKRARSNTAKLRHDERMREIYGEPDKPRTQDEIDGLAESQPPESSTDSCEIPETPLNTDAKVEHDLPESLFAPGTHPQYHEIPTQPDFLTFMKHHFRMIINDQRNLAIVLLSILVLLFSVQNLDMGSKQSPQQTETVSTESVAAISSVEVSGIIAETPMLSFVTDTVLASPSGASLAAELDDYHDPLDPRLDEDSLPATGHTTETSHVLPDIQDEELLNSVQISPLSKVRASMPTPPHKIDHLEESTYQFLTESQHTDLETSLDVLLEQEDQEYITDINMTSLKDSQPLTSITSSKSTTTHSHSNHNNPPQTPNEPLRLFIMTQTCTGPEPDFKND